MGMLNVYTKCVYSVNCINSSASLLWNFSKQYHSETLMSLLADDGDDLNATFSINHPVRGTKT